jgi:hypothetical protein
MLKCVNLKRKFRNNRSYHKSRTAHCQTVTSLLIKPLKQRLMDVTSFRLSKPLYSRSIRFKRTNNFGSVLPNRFDCRIYETKFPTKVRFLFPVFYLSYRFNFPFDAQYLSLVTVATSSRYHLPLTAGGKT